MEVRRNSLLNYPISEPANKKLLRLGIAAIRWEHGTIRPIQQNGQDVPLSSTDRCHSHADSNRRKKTSEVSETSDVFEEVTLR